MKYSIPFIALLLLAATAPVLANPFPKGDPKAGKKLVEEAKCSTCHISMFGGDGSKIFTREDRKTKTPKTLSTRVTGCKTQLGINWFPEDEEHVAAYLNQQYYKFK